MPISTLSSIEHFKKYNVNFVSFAAEKQETDSDFDLAAFIELGEDYILRILRNSWFPQEVNKRTLAIVKDYVIPSSYVTFDEDKIDSNHFLLQTAHAYYVMFLVYQAYATSADRELPAVKETVKYWKEAFQEKLNDLTITSDFYDWDADGTIEEWEKNEGPRIGSNSYMWRSL